MEPITEDELVNYLQGVSLPAGVAALYTSLANGEVADITGELTTIPVRVKAITLEVAARPLRNNGFTSVTTTADGTSKTVRREGVSADDAGVVVTAAERAELRAIVTGKPRRIRRVGSIGLRVP